MPTWAKTLLTVVFIGALMEQVNTVFYTNSRENDFPRLGRRSSNLREISDLQSGRQHFENARLTRENEALARVKDDEMDFSKDEYENAFEKRSDDGRLKADKSYRSWVENDDDKLAREELRRRFKDVVKSFLRRSSEAGNLSINS